MPELRTDWLTGRTVLVAENRAQRPNEFDAGECIGERIAALSDPSLAGDAPPAHSESCPFCAGNESRTPPAVYQALDERGRWRVRVVPNMFPAVERRTVDDHGSPAPGVHEVVVESARHAARMSALTAAEVQDALAAYAARLAHWHDSGEFRYGLVFKNQGPRAGASLAHVHSQLIALPFVPPAVERERVRAQADFTQRSACAYCRLIAREREHGGRVVLDRAGYIAFCPFASLQPLEVWLMPVEHQAWFERSLADGMAARRLAEVVAALSEKLESLIPGAAYNMLLRTAPWQPEGAACCHWRIEFLPRLNALAGLELATGVHINPLSPERAAAQLRPLERRF